MAAQDLEAQPKRPGKIASWKNSIKGMAAAPPKRESNLGAELPTSQFAQNLKAQPKRPGKFARLKNSIAKWQKRHQKENQI